MKRTSGQGKQHADGFGRSCKLKLLGGWCRGVPRRRSSGYLIRECGSVENGRVETRERRELIVKLRDEETRLNPKYFNGEHPMREQPKVEFRALRAKSPFENVYW